MKLVRIGKHMGIEYTVERFESKYKLILSDGYTCVMDTAEHRLTDAVETIIAWRVNQHKVSVNG